MLKRMLFIMIGVMVICEVAAVAAEVPINPITPDVQDKIKKSVRLVSDVDQAIAPKVKELETILKTYEPCLQAPDDRGCVQLKDQVGEKYQEVLKAIEDALPEMKKAISATARGLGESIIKKTRTSDIKRIYDNVSAKEAIPKIRGPLSKKLSKLLEALGGSSNQSVLELSLQTQADLIAASTILEYMEGKVRQLSTMVDLGRQLPIMNEDMATVMKGVADLFGYDLEYVPTVLPEEPKTKKGGYGWE